jgi:hypothetical protein
LRFLTTAGAPERELGLRLTEVQLRAAGVDVEASYVPPGAFFGPSGILARGDFDAALFAWVVTPGGRVVPEALCDNGQNFAGFCSRS